MRRLALVPAHPPGAIRAQAATLLNQVSGRTRLEFITIAKFTHHSLSWTQPLRFQDAKAVGKVLGNNAPLGKPKKGSRGSHRIPNLDSATAKSHPRYRPSRDLWSYGKASQPAGEAQPQSVSCRFHVPAQTPRVRNLAVAICNLKTGTRWSSLTPVCLHRTWRHHGGHGAQLGTGSTNERYCRARLCPLTSDAGNPHRTCGRDRRIRRTSGATRWFHPGDR